MLDLIEFSLKEKFNAPGLTIFMTSMKHLIALSGASFLAV